jgi:polyvinyl alcohol dehydrogenase (cytochrome)
MCSWSACPAVHRNDIIIGDIETRVALHDGANIIAADRTTGALHWITRVDSHVSAEITGSPVVFGDIIYVGVSSLEEGFALAGAAYPCCTFRGSVVALDADTGRLLWKTYTMPDNGGVPGGYSGGAVWQPPAIDPARGQLYVGTGNNYSAPASLLQCQQQAIDDGNSNAMCAAPDDLFDTALALDLADGHFRWSKRLQDYDVRTVPCIVPGFGVCPSPAGPDYDLGGSGPNIPSLFGFGHFLPGLVGFGSQSGSMYALNAATGRILWSFASGGTVVDGPSIVDGVLYWGSGYSNPGTGNNKLYAFSIRASR